MSFSSAGASSKKKKRKYLMRKKRTLDKGLIVDYKNPEALKRFITDRGKIIPRRISGATQEQQRSITLAVKRARYLALLPFAVCHETERGFVGEMQAVAQSIGFKPRTHSPGSGSRFQGSAPKRDDRREEESTES